MGIGDVVGNRLVVGGGKIITDGTEAIIRPINEFSSYNYRLIFDFGSDRTEITNQIRPDDEKNHNGIIKILLFSLEDMHRKPTFNTSINFASSDLYEYYLSYFLDVYQTARGHVINFDYVTMSERKS